MKNRNRYLDTRTQHGLTLVELMISLLVSLFLVAGAITVLINSRTTYTLSDDLSKLQENLRIANQFVTRDIRMAGYYGCANTQDNVNNLISLGDQLYASVIPIEGVEKSDNTVTWQPGGSNDLIADNTIISGTDAITIRGLAGGAGFVLETVMGDTSSDIDIDDDNNFAVNSLAAIYNCSSANLFQVSAVSGGLLEHTAPLGQAYEDATVKGVFFVRYFIGASANGPSLFRQVFDVVANNTIIQELVEGIENLQILYGIDTDATGVPNAYVNAANVPVWDNVVSVRFGLLGRTIDQYASAEEHSQSPASYDVNGTIIPDPADRRTRRVLTNTVLLRNLQP